MVDNEQDYRACQQTTNIRTGQVSLSAMSPVYVHVPVVLFCAILHEL